MNTRQELRAHHGMCLAYFQGKGYSEGFTAHMAKVKEMLEQHPQTELVVTDTADWICSACPSCRAISSAAPPPSGDDRPGLPTPAEDAPNPSHPGLLVCDSKEKTDRYDRAVLRLCGIESGSPMTWQDFEKRVQERILDAGRRREICGDCQWDALCHFENA